MLKPGLCSITFRKLPPAEIVRWAAQAQLAGIEWGGDVHVPHGELETARRVAKLTRDAGLAVASYGSYYRMGQEELGSFRRVLDTALALGAPIIRVWAGKKASAEADAVFRAKVADDGLRIAQMAAAEGLRVACEWHGGTLTDTGESARALFHAVDHKAFCTYWQPRRELWPEERVRDMEVALPRLIGLHVFYWDSKGRRLPLQDGAAMWQPHIAKARQAGAMFALLEFVLNEDPQQMVRDAATLREWLSTQ
jgi:3-dehydroshikimate dehydratase